jgi:GNAT superfamily N-acetyltransferase
MTVEQLSDRMADWIQTTYRAIIFSDVDPVSYALFRTDESGIYLRQLFVRRDRRRSGIGREAVAILVEEIWPSDVRLTVDVLCDNRAAVEFWRAVGYRDYCLTLEIEPRNHNAELGPRD